jgi:hypothetical protein
MLGAGANIILLLLKAAGVSVDEGSIMQLRMFQGDPAWFLSMKGSVTCISTPQTAYKVVHDSLPMYLAHLRSRLTMHMLGFLVRFEKILLI